VYAAARLRWDAHLLRAELHPLVLAEEPAVRQASRTDRSIDQSGRLLIHHLWVAIQFETARSRDLVIGQLIDEALRRGPLSRLLSITSSRPHSQVRRTADGWQLVLLGEGDIPVLDGLRHLQESGYDGCISVEWEKKWHPEIAEPEVAFPQYMRILRTYLE
jgi:hypothetical protein